jgi:hypothetical protein
MRDGQGVPVQGCPGSCGEGIHIPIVCYHFLYADGKCEPAKCGYCSHDPQRKKAILETPYHDISHLRAAIEENHNLFPLDAVPRSHGAFEVKEKVEGESMVETGIGAVNEIKGY